MAPQQWVPRGYRLKWWGSRFKTVTWLLGGFTAAFPFLCMWLQRTANEGRGVWMRGGNAGQSVAGRPWGYWDANICTVSQTDGTNFDAVRLGDPAARLPLEVCPALPCFALAALAKSCLCSGWCWLLLPPEQGSSLPAEGTYPICG